MPIKIIAEPGDASIDIVLVPGLTVEGKPEWTSEKEAVFWPQILLPQKVPKARILAFEYDGPLTIDTFWNKRVGDLSRKADYLIEELIGKRPGEKAKRPVVFIAHCLGGLVLQFGLERASPNEAGQELLDQTASILLLGTPHYNADNIEKAKPFFQLVGKELPANPELSSLSMHILKIVHEFSKLRQDSSIKVDTYYGDTPIDINGEEVWVVDESEAKQPGESPYPRAMEGNHHQISRYEGDTPDFQNVLRAITHVVDNLPKQEAKGGGTNISFHGPNAGFQLGQNLGKVNGVSIGGSGQRS